MLSGQVLGVLPESARQKLAHGQASKKEKQKKEDNKPPITLKFTLRFNTLNASNVLSWHQSARRWCLVAGNGDGGNDDEKSGNFQQIITLYCLPWLCLPRSGHLNEVRNDLS